MLRPFFSYYGTKHSIAHLYPTPAHKTIIEPFAGAASYSLHHHRNDVKLMDLDGNICMLWDYLINVSSKEIMGLPLLNADDHIDDFKLAPEQKILIGFWLGFSLAAPAKKYHQLPRKHFLNNEQSRCWCNGMKKRIAYQLQFIRHWKIQQISYTDIPNEEATWFIDPPYIEKGYCYNHNSKSIDYEHLANWIISRKGAYIACENLTAKWMDFKLLSNLTNSRNKITKEAIYTNIPDKQINLFPERQPCLSF